MRKKPSPKSNSGRVLKGIGYGAFLLLALAIGVTAGWIKNSNVMVGMLEKAFKPKQAQETFKADTVTLLILGCDEDLAPGGKKVLKKQARSDMMLIAKMDFTNKMVTGVSIPRDTRCQLPGYHAQKINAYHNIAKKGHEAELTQKAVEFLLPGIKIDRVVTLDFDHFQDLVNLVGGVPITVKKHLKYTDKAGGLYIDLKPGYQVMNGYDAMSFVRFRHADSDFVRQERQKEFLLAFKKQALKNWTKVPEIVNEGEKVLGGGLSPDEIASLALFARSVPPENIQWGQVPVTNGPGSDLTLNRKKLPAVLLQYRMIDAAEAKSMGEDEN